MHWFFHYTQRHIFLIHTYRRTVQTCVYVCVSEKEDRLYIVPEMKKRDSRKHRTDIGIYFPFKWLYTMLTCNTV